MKHSRPESLRAILTTVRAAAYPRPDDAGLVKLRAGPAAESVAEPPAPGPVVRPNERPVPHRFKRLLVALDESEQAAAAADVAAGLARELGASLVLLHVFDADFGFRPEVDFVGIDVRAEAWRRGEQVLEAAKGRTPAGVAVETTLCKGDPAAEIVSAADRFGADLIVMGTHGRGRVARAVVGSVASEVARRASCPVVTVAHLRPGLVTSADPTEEAAGVRTPHEAN